MKLWNPSKKKKKKEVNLGYVHEPGDRKNEVEVAIICILIL